MLTGTGAAGAQGDQHSGWYLLAFDEELKDGLTPLCIGRRALIVVRRDKQVQVFDATCPHRGAHLGYGGRLVRSGVVCPFHSKLILLGETVEGLYRVREHQVARFGNVIFVRLSDKPDDDRGFLDAMQAISASRHVVGGFMVPVKVMPELVIENAFDVDHFASVHGVPRVFDMRVQRGAQREIAIEGVFETRPPPWDKHAAAIPADGMLRTRFLARAFSPALVVTELGPPERSHVVITGVLPSREGCVARVAYGVAPERPGEPASAEVLNPLIEGGKKAFHQDVTVWEHLDLDAIEHLDDRDEPVRAFRQFCAEFTDAS